MAIDKGKFQEEEEAAAVARFHKIILGWDYTQLLKETETKNKKDTKAKLSVVKNTYKDVDDYFETFEPLLFEEVKAQILQNQDPEEEASGSELRLVMECSEADGFHILQVTDERVEDDKVNKYKSLGPNDLLLLSKEEVKGSSFPSSYGFAIVENRLSSTSLRLRMYLAEEVVQITKKNEIL